MSGNNSIIPFAQAADANVITDQQYQTDVNGGTLQKGFIQGIAKSEEVNKVLRQATSIAAGIAQFLANEGYDIDDSISPQTLASYLATKITQNQSFIQAWSQTTSNTLGGYPKYSVVADPNILGLLYESNSDNNTEQPSQTATYWTPLQQLPAVPVTAFGVTNDPNGNNISNNTQNYMRALQESAGAYRLIHPMGLNVMVSELTITNSNIQWQLDGWLKLANGSTSNLLNIVGNVQNFHLSGVGSLTCEGQNSATPLGAIIAVNASDASGQSSQYQAVNININGVQLTGANYAFFGNNCLRSVVQNCLINNTKYGCIFSNGNDNHIRSNSIFNNSQLGAGLNNAIYNSSIMNNKIYSNQNQALNLWAAANQTPPQFCIIKDNFIRDNQRTGITILSTTPSQYATDIKIINNVFQNNGINGTGNDIYAQSINELTLRGNTFDRFSTSYTQKLTKLPNSVWLDNTVQQAIITCNTFKDCGSSVNYGIPLWIENTIRCSVNGNTFMDTMGITQQWAGGSFGIYSQAGNNSFIGSTHSGKDQELGINTIPENETGQTSAICYIEDNNNGHGDRLYIPTNMGTIVVQTSQDTGWVEGSYTYNYAVPYRQVFGYLSHFIGRDYGTQDQGYTYSIGNNSATVNGAFAGKFIVVGFI